MLKNSTQPCRILLLIALLLLTTAAVLASEPAASPSAKRITAIHIDGVVLTNAGVVRAQLPFAVGDPWNDRLVDLTAARLRILGNYWDTQQSPRITTAPDGPDGVQVTVTVHEWPRWWPGWVQLGVTAATALSSQQAGYTVNNLTSSGLTIGTGVYWGDTSGAVLYAQQPIASNTGGVCIAQGWSLDSRHNIWTGRYYGSSFEQLDRSLYLTVRSLVTPTVDASCSIGYAKQTYTDATLYGGLDLSPQQHVVLAAGLRTPATFRDGLACTLSGSYWTALSNGTSFPSLDGVLEWRQYHGRWGAYSRLAAGATSANAPYVGLKRVGGALLRGTAYNYFGDRYATGTLELRRRIVPRCELFGFTDTGATWQGNQRTTGARLPLTVGGGATLSAPYGVPVKVTVGYDTVYHNYGWGVQIGRTF